MIKKTFFILPVLAVVALGVIYTADQLHLFAQIRNKITQKMKQDFGTRSVPTIKPFQKSPVVFSFAAISDVHNNIEGLQEAIKKINQSGAEFVIGTGDYTNTGTTEEFKKIKEITSKLKKPFYALPGDHDLWNGRDKTSNPLTYYQNEFDVAPKAMQSHDTTFIFINNADIYIGINSDEFERIKQEIVQAKTPIIVIVSHKALYHPLTIHRMGYINSNKIDEVSTQADELMEIITSRVDKKIYLIHGDLHSSSSFNGPTDNIINFTNGALTKQKNFQTPRFELYEVSNSHEISQNDYPIE